MIKNFLKKIFGFGSKDATKIPDEQKVVEKRKTNEPKPANLNQITLKMGEGKNPGVNTTEDKPKKKRYYKKKPKTTTDKVEQAPKPQKNEKTEGVKKDTPTKTNGTTKKRYRSKKPKSPTTVQSETRTDK